MTLGPARRTAPLGSRIGDDVLVRKAHLFLMKILRHAVAPASDRILATLSRFRRGLIAADDLREHLRHLIGADPELVDAFNAFVPEVRMVLATSARPRCDPLTTLCPWCVHTQAYQIKPGHTRKKAVSRERAVRYVSDIRSRVGVDAYRKFKRLLRIHHRTLVPFAWTYRRVAILLKDHLDLVHEFETFVPDVLGGVTMRQTLLEESARAKMIHGGNGAAGDGDVSHLIDMFHALDEAPGLSDPN